MREPLPSIPQGRGLYSVISKSLRKAFASVQQGQRRIPVTVFAVKLQSSCFPGSMFSQRFAGRGIPAMHLNFCYFITNKRDSSQS